MKNFSPFIIAVLIFATHAAFSDSINLTAECTTKATGWSGARNSSDSQLQCQTVPNGYVTIGKSLSTSDVNANSYIHECRHYSKEYVEVNPDAG